MLGATQLKIASLFFLIIVHLKWFDEAEIVILFLIIYSYQYDLVCV